MPFTPTHVLAALPIARRWSGPGVFSALVIGAMIPDWPLYIPVGPSYVLTHSFPGIIIACLPVGLSVTLLFLAVARRSLFELTSPGLQRRLARYLDASPDWSITGITKLAAAVCIGAATHIVWDAFTHGRTWGVSLFPALQDVWVTICGVKFVGYLVLQHGSSLIGLPLMAVLYMRWYRRAECHAAPAQILRRMSRWAWIVLLVGFPLAAVVRHIAGISQFGLRPLISALYYGVMEAGFMLIMLVACYSLLFYPVAKYRRKNDTVA